MPVRLKVVCNYIDPHGNICLTPVVSGSEENKEFFKYTPGGEVKFWTINEAAKSQFEIGKEYYVDIKRAE